MNLAHSIASSRHVLQDYAGANGLNLKDFAKSVPLRNDVGNGKEWFGDFRNRMLKGDPSVSTAELIELWKGGK